MSAAAQRRSPPSAPSVSRSTGRVGAGGSPASENEGRAPPPARGRRPAQRGLEARDGRPVGDEIAGRDGVLDASARERQVHFEDAGLGGKRIAPTKGA